MKRPKRYRVSVRQQCDLVIEASNARQAASIARDCTAVLPRVIWRSAMTSRKWRRAEVGKPTLHTEPIEG